MQVTCPYCGSYVEVDNEGKCPDCTAPLGEEVAEQQRLAEEKAAAERARAEAEAEEREHEEQVERVVSGIGAVAASLLGGAVLSGMGHGGGHMPPPPGGMGGHGGGHMPPPGGMGGMPF